MNLDSGRPIATGVQWTRVPVDFQLMLERVPGALRAMGGRGPGAIRVGRRFGGGELVAEDTVVEVAGDVAITVGYEWGGVVVDGGAAAPTMIRVTHVYRREDRDWRLVHRHGDFGPTDEVGRPERRPKREGGMQRSGFARGREPADVRAQGSKPVQMESYLLGPAASTTGEAARINAFNATCRSEGASGCNGSGSLAVVGRLVAARASSDACPSVDGYYYSNGIAKWGYVRSSAG